MENIALLLKLLPLPPTINSSYFNIPGRGRAPSKELREFKKAVDAWVYQNKGQLDMFETLRSSAWGGATIFNIHCYFIMSRRRLYTLDGRPKKMDVSNRIKHIEDAISYAIGVDDSKFWMATGEKIEGDIEGVVVLIEPHEPMTSVELMARLNGQQDTTSHEQ